MVNVNQSDESTQRVRGPCESRGRARGFVLQRTAVASLKRLRFVLQGPPLKGDDYARSKHLSEGTSEALIGRRPGQGGRRGNDRVERRTTRLGSGRTENRRAGVYHGHDAGRFNLELFSLTRQRLGLDLDPKPPEDLRGRTLVERRALLREHLARLRTHKAEPAALWTVLQVGLKSTSR